MSFGRYVQPMTNNDWASQFRQVFDRGIAAWQAGRKSPSTMFTREDVAFLATIGCTAQELFDFVDDNQRYGEPDFESTLGVTSLRRDYFLQVLHGQSTGKIFPMAELPSKPAAVDGIPWLPRIIAKARIKLRGEMPDELMYGCGGDRDFLSRTSLTLPQFLKLVWDSGADDRKIIDAVKKSAGRA